MLREGKVVVLINKTLSVLDIKALASASNDTNATSSNIGKPQVKSSEITADHCPQQSESLKRDTTRSQLTQEQGVWDLRIIGILEKLRIQAERDCHLVSPEEIRPQNVGIEHQEPLHDLFLQLLACITNDLRAELLVNLAWCTLTLRNGRVVNLGEVLIEPLYQGHVGEYDVENTLLGNDLAACFVLQRAHAREVEWVSSKSVLENSIVFHLLLHEVVHKHRGAMGIDHLME